MSGAEQAAAKEKAAAIMREKQAKGEYIWQSIKSQFITDGSPQH